MTTSISRTEVGAKPASHSLNTDWFERAKSCIPGGVNSPVRAFAAVDATPRFISRAAGPYLWDVEGQRYIEYINSWGPAILGHAHPAVIEAVQNAATQGLSYGAPTPGEVEMAHWLTTHLPSLEQVRLVSSGTEATMSAVRLARGFTRRDVIVKFEGCYHGHADSLLVKAGSGALTFGQPTSAGVPADFTRHTLVLPYNDIDAFEQCMRLHGERIAGVIVEPIAGNMNLVRPRAGFLEALRAACDATGALLIFDEVMTGFRVGPQGAQGLHDIRPDLTTLGKIIGGGLPVGAFGGRADIMACVAPLGPVYQAGTLSGNPVAVAAGLATLQLIAATPDFYPRLARQTQRLTDGINQAAQAAGIACCADAVGGMFGIYCRDVVPTSLAAVQQSDINRFKRLFRLLLARGVYFAPSAFEAGFVSITHDDAVIDETLAHLAFAFEQLQLDD